MTSQSATIAPAEEMGQVHIPVTLTSYGDLLRVDAGELPAAAVRTYDAGPIVADTGASHLCLPSSLIAQLGLRLVEEIVVETAHGPSSTRLFTGVWITVDGRSRLVSCVELPGGETPLLGAIPMEDLGIELDLRNRTYWLRPSDGPQTYLMA